jgi:diguanylate cyclase (GGDEF)-like protein/PAS domain S-box-containing protein
LWALTRDPVLRGLLVLGIVFCVWYPLAWGPLALRVVAYWVLQVLSNVVFVYFCIRVCRLPTLSIPVRRFWQRISVGGALFVLADLAQTVVSLRQPNYDTVPNASLPAVILLGGVGATLWAMLRHPIQARGRERLTWWLDSSTILTGAAAFIWTFLWFSEAPRPATRIAVILIASTLMLVSAFGLIKLLLGGNAPFTRATGVISASTAALFGVDTAITSAETSPTTTNATMAVQLVASVLLTAIPRIQEVQVRADPGILYRPPRRPYSRLPYLGLAATQLLLVGVLLVDGLGGRAWGVLAAALVATALVVVRQLVAFSDNARLLASLDETTLTARRQEERFRSLVQNAWDLTVVADKDGRITYASPATERILGVRPEDVMGGRYMSLMNLEDVPTMQRTMARLLHTENVTFTTSLRARHVDGSWRWLEIVSTNLLADPSVRGLVLNVRDVTETHLYQERLRHEATHDSLTRLGNRALFDERAHEAGQTATPDDRVGILAIDLDDFKTINDTLGHHIGDGLLAAVAERLMGCVRPADTLARIGGDEFAILLPGANAAEATGVAERILAVLGLPVLVEGHALPARASIGVAVGSRGDIDSLLHASDAAMYEAKKSGKNTYLAAG